MYTRARAHTHTHVHIYINISNSTGVELESLRQNFFVDTDEKEQALQVQPECARVFVCCKGWAGAVWPEEEEEEESGKGGSARMANFQHVVRNVQNCNACGRVQALLLELEEEAEVYREGISKVFPI